MSARITALVLSASCTLLFASGGCTATVVEPAPDGGAPPAATSPQSAPTDEPAIDAGRPVADAGADADADADADDGVCHPDSAAGFTGSPYEAPDPSGPGKCTDRLIDAFLE